MKTKLLFVVLFLLSTKLNAQSWAQPGAHWFFQDGDNAQIGYSGYIEVSKISDTLINGLMCDVLACHHVGIKWWTGGTPYDYYSPNQYTRVSNDTVYQWQNGQFYVLYVFNVQPMNYWITGPGFYGTGCTGDTITIDYSQTVNINGISMQKLIPEPYGSIPFPNGGASIFLHDTIYERFGCVSFLFPIDACVTDIPVPQLRCYSDSSGFTYSRNISPSCDFVWTGINETNYSDPLSVYPNPTSDYLTVLSNFNPGDKITLFDISGNAISENVINSSGSHVNIATSKFSNGLYFLEVKTGNRVIFKKIFVQH